MSTFVSAHKLPNLLFPAVAELRSQFQPHLYVFSYAWLRLRILLWHGIISWNYSWLWLLAPDTFIFPLDVKGLVNTPRCHIFTSDKFSIHLFPQKSEGQWNNPPLHSRKDENGNQGGPYVWACGKNHLKADDKQLNEWVRNKKKKSCTDGRTTLFMVKKWIRLVWLPVHLKRLLGRRVV